MQANAKFACFFKKYSITLFNDALAKYRDLQINAFDAKESEKKNWENVLAAYRTESETLQTAIEENKFNADLLTTEEIKNLISSLYELKYTGPVLKEIMKFTEDAEGKIKLYNENNVEKECSKMATASKSSLLNLL